ncbi:hypothetical protein D3C81_2001660 [compost metagenome]
MQADGNMLLQIQRLLKGPQQAFVLVVVMRRQHMHLLIALGDQIHRFLLANQQRGQRFFGIDVLG